MNLSLAIFDFDGTIMDSREGIGNCVRYALSSIGIYEEDEEKLLRFIGPPLHESFKKYYSLDDEAAARMVDKYRERYRPVGYRECELYDGILELVGFLRAHGVKTAIASFKPQEFVVKICMEKGFADSFDVIVGANLEDTDSDKTRLLKKAIAGAGNPDARGIVMVGDGKPDMLAAKKLGLYCVGVEYGFGAREELLLAGAEKIAKTVDDLRNILVSFWGLSTSPNYFD